MAFVRPPTARAKVSMQPVEYEGTAADIVKAFNERSPEKKQASYWSENEISAVRKVIKDHYIKEQSQRCCYCQHQIQTNNNAVWDCEHIISRDNRPEFMFEPRNLAISCKDCNIAKAEQNVLRNKEQKTFPIKPENYLVVHPHFDVYVEHLLWFGPVVTPASSDSTKGATTIKMCNLYRYAQECAGLKGDIGDQRYRDRIGELLTARSEASAKEILGELEVQIAKLPKQ